MKVLANIFISKNGSLRITKKDAAAYPSELGVQIVIDVPDIFFTRPVPRVELTVPKEYLVNPDAEVAARWVAQDVADALQLEVKTVEDGLMTMMKDKLKNQDMGNMS